MTKSRAAVLVDLNPDEGREREHLDVVEILTRSVSTSVHIAGSCQLSLGNMNNLEKY